MKYLVIGMLLSCYLLPLATFAQDETGTSTTDKVINFPSKFFSRIQSKTTDLNKQLTAQTEKYLQKMAKREERLKKKLYRTDSTVAKNLSSCCLEQPKNLPPNLRIVCWAS